MKGHRHCSRSSSSSSKHKHRKGHRGPKGHKGEKGDKGSRGCQGAQGPDGAQGPQGAQGAKGATGAQGPQGAQGAQGANGYDGAQGPQGYQGIQGYPGSQGDQGAQGYQGIQGYQGVQGYPGVQGEQGPIGEQGPPGPQGPIGEQGPPGVQGADGGQGAQGAQGANGAKGENGDKGVQGDAGVIQCGEYPTQVCLSNIDNILFQRTGIQNFTCPFGPAEWSIDQTPTVDPTVFNVTETSLFLSVDNDATEIPNSTTRAKVVFTNTKTAFVSFDWSLNTIYPTSLFFVQSDEDAFVINVATSNTSQTLNGAQTLNLPPGTHTLYFGLTLSYNPESGNFPKAELTLTNFNVLFEECEINTISYENLRDQTEQNVTNAIANTMFKKTLSFNSHQMTKGTSIINTFGFGQTSFPTQALTISQYNTNVEDPESTLLQFLVPDDFQGTSVQIEVNTLLRAANSSTSYFYSWQLETFCPNDGMFTGTTSPTFINSFDPLVFVDNQPFGTNYTFTQKMCIPASSLIPGKLAVIAMNPTGTFPSTLGVTSLNISYLTKLETTLC